jgi:Glyoxalase/Bleomycin resistance protein/Dioxygenase superfamily
MPAPVFTETLQISVVVRDLEQAMRTYVEEYGIGPWDIYEFNSETVREMRESGQSVERSWRLALANVGQVQWELIQPLDDESVYARFLSEKGEGSTTSPSRLPASTTRSRHSPRRETAWFSAASSVASSPRSSAAHPAPT